MNGKAASRRIGITYDQLRYFVKRIDYFAKKDATRDHYHDFTFRDLAFLQLAAMMRADGIRLSEINNAISLLDEARKVSRIPGTLVYRSDVTLFSWDILDEPVLEKGRWIWSPTIIRASENLANGMDESNMRILKHIPGMLYSVLSVFDEMSRDDQMQLEFNKHMEVNEET